MLSLCLSIAKCGRRPWAEVTRYRAAARAGVIFLPRAAGALIRKPFWNRDRLVYICNTRSCGAERPIPGARVLDAFEANEPRRQFP